MIVFPYLYDAAMAPLERGFVRRLRRSAIEPLSGELLDVGAGSGVNFVRYGSAARPIALDLGHAMLRRAARRPHAPPLVQADAQRLPFPDARFDVVLFTLVLCSVDEPALAVDEGLRVLRPGGRLVLVEHVVSPKPAVARLQSRLTPAWRHLAGGCRLDRDPETLLRERRLRRSSRETALGGIFVTSTWVRDVGVR